MSVVLQPKPFHPTEHAFTVSCEFDENTVGYIEYSKHNNFPAEKTRGGPEYGFSATANIPITHLVAVDPSIAGPGDVVYYRLKIFEIDSFVNGTTHKVRLRRSRSSSTGWSFVISPSGTNGSSLSSVSVDYFLPAIKSTNADFVCLPGGLIEPNSTTISTSRNSYKNLRELLDGISVPIFLSPGETEAEESGTNRQARHEYFPCANFRARGHQCIRTPQADWQEIESPITTPPTSTEASVGSYYSYSWGNALFIHINDWLRGNDSISHNKPDLTNSLYDHQREWLESVLKEHRHKYKWCFMFTHSPVDEQAPDIEDSIALVPDSRSYLMSIHSQFKVTAHFHGQYGGWRVHQNSDTVYVCSSFGKNLGSGGSGSGWNSEHGFAQVHIGVDENGNNNSDYIKIEIIGVGLGNDQGEILSSNGVLSHTGQIIDHNSENQDISNVNMSFNVIPLGSTWIYNDNNDPQVDDVDFIIGTNKFYLPDFSPSMFNENFSGTEEEIKQLWKVSNAPFTSSSIVPIPWGAYYSAHTNIDSSPVSVGYSYPSWANPTTLSTRTSTDIVSNPIYFIKKFDIPENISPTEIQLIYNLRDVAFIWINGELAYNTSGTGNPVTLASPFSVTRRPSIDNSWILEDGYSLSNFEPFSTDADDPDDSRTKNPSFHYETANQPVKINNPSVINKLNKTNNTISVLLILGRESTTSRDSSLANFDMSVTVLGNEQPELFSPHIVSPSKFQMFNQGVVNITWNAGNLPEDKNEDKIVYEIEYTDKYSGGNTNWHSVKRRIQYGKELYDWVVGNSIKSNTVRIRIRIIDTETGEKSEWSISDEFSINVFDLIAPAIINPIPYGIYSDFILIILDEYLTKNTYHQKVRYSIEYSSQKRDIDWTPIVTNMTVGQTMFRWNLDGVPASDDYILRLTAQNSSTSCEDHEENQPDQIAKRFVYNINIQQTGLFLIDTKPPVAILEIENNFGITNKLDQIINIFSYDETTEVNNVRIRECDAGSSLGLGDIEDPYDPLGGCSSIESIIGDLSLFGKSIDLSPKMRWKFDDKSGLKKIEALLTDAGGNTSLQEQIRVFLSVFSTSNRINDFIVVLEQRDKISINAEVNPPQVISTPSVFEVVYLITSQGELWVLEPFPRLVWTLDPGTEPVLLIEFNQIICVLSYKDTDNMSHMYVSSVNVPILLFSFTPVNLAGKNLPSAVTIFKNKLYIGMENGDLWSYNGLVFSHISMPILAPISSLYGDNEYLYVGFENSDNVVLYNETSSTILGL